MPVETIAFRNGRYKVSDLSAAKEFYSRAFAVKPFFDEPTWVVFQIHDYLLWLEPDHLAGESVFESANPFYESSTHTMLTFWAVDDVKAVCTQFKKLGGTILTAPNEDDPFTNAVVIDPWNNKLGLHSSLI